MNVVTGFLNQMNSYMPYAYGAAGIAFWSRYSIF